MQYLFGKHEGEKESLALSQRAGFEGGSACLLNIFVTLLVIVIYN